MGLVGGWALPYTLHGIRAIECYSECPTPGVGFRNPSVEELTCSECLE